ncbi:hypothetical protein M011DRAFT_456536 [Sporormia fimetaria CBS 119925]|uniref:Uncharacterized protein n=1 Tax=Sporormia fimetaria CBS 119925 TaxID=1340428 RepID=A0A6A6VJP0_9PLEO|nr:hypothetical protein M011DRAFT_456536 [Sporormia fimetaria CBS 119925]
MELTLLHQTHFFTSCGLLVSAILSFDHIRFDDLSSAGAMGTLRNPTVGNLVIRGVSGGRRKRYIIKREEDRLCCRDKLCPSVLGQILDRDCSCKKCPTGVPALDGRTCQENCPQGQAKNDKGGCYPIGQRPNAAGNGCNDDPDTSRKGKCPAGQALDPKWGHQDPNTPNPKCAIDDEKHYARPKVPSTRPDGKETDASYKVECGDPDPNNRVKCNPKTHYVDVWVDTKGKANERCEQNKGYRERKRNKPKELRQRLKERWEKEKPDREKKESERKENRRKLEDHYRKFEAEKKEREKIQDEKDRKKARMGKCVPVVALLIGARENTGRVKRDEEHPYDWTSDYFDECFMLSDERLLAWPEGLSVNEIQYVTDAGVDADAWMRSWEHIAAASDLENYVPCSCGKRSLGRRCRRSMDDLETDEDDDYIDYQRTPSKSKVEHEALVFRSEADTCTADELRK